MMTGRTSMKVCIAVFVGVITALFVLTSCAAKLPPEAPWEKDARALLDQAEKGLSRRQYSKAEALLSAFDTKYSESRQMDRALYLRGEIRLARRDYSRALSYYKEVIERFPSSSLILDAKYKLGLCYFELREFDLAIANLKDRSTITDPAKLRRAAEMLAAAYQEKEEYMSAVNEYITLLGITKSNRQKKRYREQIDEIIEKNLTRDELADLSEGTAFPADRALLRLTGLLVEKRKYRKAFESGEDFLKRFPNHPDTVRVEMLMAEAKVKLSEPRHYIGVLAPQSGRLAFFGDRVLKGIKLAIHSYNLRNPDNKVEVIVQDTKGSPKRAKEAIVTLEKKDVLAVVGPLLTREAEAIAPLLKKLEIPVITPAASGPGVGNLSPWLFRNALTNGSQAAAAAQHALGRKLRKFVILYPEDAYGKGLALLFNKELVKRAEILAEVPYPPDTNDFGPYIRKIINIDLRSLRIPIPEDDDEMQALIRDYEPSFDAIYLPGDADKVGLLIPQLAFYNMTQVAMIGSNNWHTEELLNRAGRHADGAVFVDGFFPESDDPAVASIVDAYRSAYQEEPDILSAQAYDATMIILSLLREERDSPEAMRDGIWELEDFPGLSGYTTFKGSGEAQKELFLIQVKDGKFVRYSD